MTDVDLSKVLTHHGVKGMKWGVRKDKKNKPLSKREKVLVGSLVASGVLLAAGAITITSLKVRNTQHKISAARGYAWVENMLQGDMQNFQTTTPEQLRRTFPNKNTYNVVEQYLRNKDMLRYING